MPRYRQTRTRLPLALAADFPDAIAAAAPPDTTPNRLDLPASRSPARNKSKQSPAPVHMSSRHSFHPSNTPLSPAGGTPPAPASRTTPATGLTAPAPQSAAPARELPAPPHSAPSGLHGEPWPRPAARMHPSPPDSLPSQTTDRAPP